MHQGDARNKTLILSHAANVDKCPAFLKQIKPAASGPKSNSGVSQARVDPMKVGLAFRQHLTQQLKAGRYSSFRQAAANERDKFW